MTAQQKDNPSELSLHSNRFLKNSECNSVYCKACYSRRHCGSKKPIQQLHKKLSNHHHCYEHAQQWNVSRGTVWDHSKWNKWFQTNKQTQQLLAREVCVFFFYCNGSIELQFASTVQAVTRAP